MRFIGKSPHVDLFVGDHSFLGASRFGCWVLLLGGCGCAFLLGWHVVERRAYAEREGSIYRLRVQFAERKENERKKRTATTSSDPSAPKTKRDREFGELFVYCWYVEIRRNLLEILRGTTEVVIYQQL